MTATATPLAALVAAGVRVHHPGDAGYDAARTPWNVAVDQHPAAVAEPRTTAEVAEVVRAAAAAGLRVAPQGTGHNAGPLGDLRDTVLLRTSAMTDAVVHADGTMTVGAGTLWEEAVTAAAAAGRAVLHGSSPDVGVVGYSLGGGLGWYARSLGLQANAVTGAEVVLADGRVAWVDATHHPELFWALRGGGGNLGVVTRLRFRTFDVGPVHAGMLVWDRRDAEKVLRRWATWSAGAPDEVTTSFRVLQLPPLPQLPEMLRGRQLVVVNGAVRGDAERAQEVLAPLRELAPEIDTVAPSDPASLVRLHMDPEGPTPGVSDSAVLAELPDAAVDAFLGVVGDGTSTSLLVAELRQLGGVLARPAEGGGALADVPGHSVLFGCGIAPDAAAAGQIARDAGALVEALRPWASRRTYLNFAETAVDPASGYDAGSFARLRAVRAAADPDGLFRANHAVDAG